MKIIMFMGVPGSNNLELAHFLQCKYPQSLIFNRDNVKKDYRNLPANSPIIDFIFIQKIKGVIAENPTDVIIIVAPFVLKDSRERFFEAFADNEFFGVWVERSKEELLSINSTLIPSYQNTIEEINYALKYKVSPTFDEPFSDITYITREINTGMSRDKPYITDIETALLRI